MTPSRTMSRVRRLLALVTGRDTPETVAREAQLRQALADFSAKVSAGCFTQAQAEQTLAALLPPCKNGAHDAPAA